MPRLPSFRSTALAALRKIRADALRVQDMLTPPSLHIYDDGDGQERYRMAPRTRDEIPLSEYPENQLEQLRRMRAYLTIAAREALALSAALGARIELLEELNQHESIDSLREPCPYSAEHSVVTCPRCQLRSFLGLRTKLAHTIPPRVLEPVCQLPGCGCTGKAHP
jgi:hypothetical protein